jgi:hypothetical protein
MYDTQHGALCICVAPTKEPPEFVLVDPIWFFCQGGAIAGIEFADKKRDIFFEAGSVGFISEELVVIFNEQVANIQNTLAFFIQNGIINEEACIDVTSYSLEKLQTLIIASVESFEKSINPTKH